MTKNTITQNTRFPYYGKISVKEIITLLTISKIYLIATFCNFQPMMYPEYKKHDGGGMNKKVGNKGRILPSLCGLFDLLEIQLVVLVASLKATT